MQPVSWFFIKGADSRDVNGFFLHVEGVAKTLGKSTPQLVYVNESKLLSFKTMLEIFATCWCLVLSVA